MRSTTVLVLLFTLVNPGCGGGRAPQMVQHGMSAGAPGAKEADEEKAAGKDAVPLPRKIIYTADVQLVVEDFGVVEQKLAQLVKDTEGAYVAGSEVTGAPGSPRWGRWKVRVPVERREKFQAAVGDLGQLQRSTLDSKDVTEEYYDVDAQIKNRKVEEERLVGHLKNSTGKLEDILAVERELSRVRKESDQLQGRLQRLANQTTLSTLTINITERKDYFREQDPGFATTISRTFWDSLDGLLAFGKCLLLILVALTPWLPLLVVVVGVPIWKLRRWLRCPRPSVG